ncbi:uncharacterized protein LOC144452626 isoform X2 [Glandiceps talaboti]
MRVLLLLAVALTGALAQECPSNIPWEAIAKGASQDENELYDEQLRPVYEISLFEIEEGYTPYESHTVGIVANDKTLPFIDFTVTVKNNDELCSAGVLKATNSRSSEVKSCPQVLVASDDKIKTKVSFRWKAPECGCVTIKATIMSDLTTYYMDDIGTTDGYLTKTVCPVGVVLPDITELTEEELEAIETADAIAGLSDDDVDMLQEIVESLVEEDSMETALIPGINVDISNGDMNMVIYNEICSEERQQTSLSNPVPHRLSIYPCCRVMGEERRDCFLTTEHPQYVLEKMEEARLTMMCDKMSMPDSEDLKNINREIYFCCVKPDMEERKQCFKEAKSERYNRFCRGENDNMFFTLNGDSTPNNGENREHFCCTEEGEDLVTCFDNEERRRFFPRVGEDVDEEAYDEMEGRRLERVCKRFESEEDEDMETSRRRHHRPRFEILRRCCQEPRGERRECIRQAKHERINSVCSTEETDDMAYIGGDEDEDMNELVPKYDRTSMCCQVNGEIRYSCFKRKLIQRYKMANRPMPQGPKGDMIMGHIEDSRIDRLCTKMTDGSMEDYDVKDDIVACCELPRLERNKCFKMSERTHLDNVCTGEEVDYMYRLGHYGEFVEEEDMDDVVTMDNPCCEESDEERYECFDLMSRLHLWTHRPRVRPMHRRPWRMDPEDRFSDEHREKICEKVMSGSEEEVEKELDDDESDRPNVRKGWRMQMESEELMDKMRQCCMMVGDESRQCMEESRKMKVDMTCERIEDEEDTGMWMYKKKQCCEKSGEERYNCFVDMHKRMPPFQKQTQKYWKDPENRFSEEHRERICTRLVEDDDPEDVEKEVDEEVEKVFENLALGKIMSNFRGMLGFFYRKLAKDTEFMDKISDCCLEVGDEDARNCFEEARKIRVDNMCEMAMENEEESEDGGTGFGIMGRMSFWMSGKRRCCSMEGDERYECMDEMKKPGMIGGMQRPDMGRPGPHMMGRWGKDSNEYMGQQGKGHDRPGRPGMGRDSDETMRPQRPGRPGRPEMGRDSDETMRPQRPGRPGRPGMGRDSDETMRPQRPGRPGRPGMGRDSDETMTPQRPDGRPGMGRPFRGVMIPTTEEKIELMCWRITTDDTETGSFSFNGRTRPQKNEGNKEELRTCCRKSGEERRSCVEVIRRQNIDKYCDESPAPSTDRPLQGFPLMRCCSNEGEELYECFTNEVERRQTGRLDEEKVDEFCETPVARTVLLRGMPPSRPGLPPAWCCEYENTERYECFSQAFPNMYIAPQFDLTADSVEPEQQYHPYQFYRESSEEERPYEPVMPETMKPEDQYIVDPRPVYEQVRREDYVDDTDDVNVDESSSSDDDEYEDEEEMGRCCRVGHAVGSKIDNFKFVQCTAKSVQFAQKKEVSRRCRRAFVRCCVGRKEKRDRD